MASLHSSVRAFVAALALDEASKVNEASPIFDPVTAPVVVTCVGLICDTCHAITCAHTASRSALAVSGSAGLPAGVTLNRANLIACCTMAEAWRINGSGFSGWLPSAQSSKSSTVAKVSISYLQNKSGSVKPPLVSYPVAVPLRRGLNPSQGLTHQPEVWAFRLDQPHRDQRWPNPQGG